LFEIDPHREDAKDAKKSFFYLAVRGRQIKTLLFLQADEFFSRRLDDKQAVFGLGNYF
jgi:hypothetical protein